LPRFWLAEASTRPKSPTPGTAAPKTVLAGQEETDSVPPDQGIMVTVKMDNLAPKNDRAVPFMRDAVLGLVADSELCRYYEGRYYALEKKQLNSHEIRRWVHPVLRERSTSD
jgi:hypothetical protein